MPPETMHETPKPGPAYEMPYVSVSKPTSPPVEPYKPNRVERRRASTGRIKVNRGRKVHSPSWLGVDGNGLPVGNK